MKTKKNIIVVILLLTFLFLGAFLFLNKKQGNDFFDNIESSLSCGKEGEAIGASNMPNSCCSGLKSLGGWPGGYNDDCDKLPPPGGLSICTKCGNNQCETYNSENKCNCPEDCR